MLQSEHDKRMEQVRAKEYELLLALYEERAAQESEEYGFLNVRGQEVPDPTVVEPPLGYVETPDLAEIVRSMVRNELSRRAAEEEMETFEDADDFDVDDDIDPESPYELYFDPSPGSPAGPSAAPEEHPDPAKKPDLENSGTAPDNAPPLAPANPPPASPK